MRHRIGSAGLTGLGNSSPASLNNNKSLNSIIKKMLNDAIKLYFKKWNGCDYQINQDEISFGIEPAYMYEDLKIISINKDIARSYIRTGRAFDVYGSGIRSTTKIYRDYKKKCQFKNFIDEWHPKLFNK